VARKLAQRASAAAEALRDAVAALRAAHASLEAAMRTMSPTDTGADAPASEPTDADAPTPPVARAGPAAPPLFDPQAFPDMVIYAALPLSALGALRCDAAGL
jgi:hypothetical protein